MVNSLSCAKPNNDTATKNSITFFLIEANMQNIYS